MKILLMRPVGALLLAAMVFLLAGCGAPGTAVIAASGDHHPFNFVNQSGQTGDSSDWLYPPWLFLVGLGALGLVFFIIARGKRVYDARTLIGKEILAVVKLVGPWLLAFACLGLVISVILVVFFGAPWDIALFIVPFVVIGGSIKRLLGIRGGGGGWWAGGDGGDGGG